MKSFESELARLDWLIGQIEQQVTNRQMAPPAAELLDVFVVTSSWLNSAIGQAKAVLLLVTQDLSCAVGSLERALWELWIDWRYFLRQEDRPLNAAKVVVNAKLEVLDFIEAHPGAFDTAYIARLRRNLQEYESRHPHASAGIRDQRKKRRYHWSGISRSEMERTRAGSATAYRFFSWEAHGMMSTIRDVSIDIEEGIGRIWFGRQGGDRDINRRAWTTGGVLFYMYNEFAELWGLPALALPNEEDSPSSGSANLDSRSPPLCPVMGQNRRFAEQLCATYASIKRSPLGSGTGWPCSRAVSIHNWWAWFACASAAS